MATLTLDPPAAPGTAPERRDADRMTPKRLVGTVVLYVLLIAASAAIMLPFVWMIISSLKTNNQVFTVPVQWRSEEHTSELQSRGHLVCRLLLEKKKTTK